jgi:hypothetical protein
MSNYGVGICRVYHAPVIEHFIKKGDIVDKRINRFKLCDLRFHPYLRRVIGRLPEEIREIVLNDMTYQILTDDEILEALVLRYEFGVPIRTLVYLNTKILKEPDHQIIKTIASEIAHHISKKEESHVSEREVDDLLIKWGFEKEVEAVRYDLVMTESEEYRIGYDWAKQQDTDDLMQHFGLFFDQWNDKGLGRLSSKELNMYNRKVETGQILEDILPFNKLGSVESDNGKIPDSLSNWKAMLAGIFTAVKEANL